MQTAHEPYSAPYEPTMVAIPEPPRWPRLVARIVGTIGLVLIGPLALIMVFATVYSLVDGGEKKASLLRTTSCLGSFLSPARRWAWDC